MILLDQCLRWWYVNTQDLIHDRVGNNKINIFNDVIEKCKESLPCNKQQLSFLCGQTQSL